ncbi:MAG: hypothetical protein M3253_07840 [Chloroflexota bacterium]|nr:hypothetical protein [Chloroflexota bacterium]
MDRLRGLRHARGDDRRGLGRRGQVGRHRRRSPVYGRRRQSSPPRA